VAREHVGRRRERLERFIIRERLACSLTIHPVLPKELLRVTDLVVRAITNRITGRGGNAAAVEGTTTGVVADGVPFFGSAQECERAWASCEEKKIDL
jgi:hypothetical protein